LLWRVTRVEVAGRYAGSTLGLGWVVLSPLLFLGTYAVVYLQIFKVQAPGLSPAEYLLYIFAGLVPFLATAEALTQGVSSIAANKAIISNTVFPIDLVPVKAVLASQATMVVGFTLIVAAAGLTGRASWTWVVVPVVWACHVLALIGLNWVLSLLNVVLRDLQNLVGLMLMLTLIASPIAYTPDMVPASLNIVLLVNPFAYFVTAYQGLLVLGHVPSAGHLLVLLGVAIGFFFIGSRFFAGVKRTIVDHV
jgi:lipopolysaccharide transport system permease protein